MEDHKDVHQQGEEVVRDRDEEEEESVNKVLSSKSLFSRRKLCAQTFVLSLRNTTTAIRRKKGEDFMLRILSTRGQMPMRLIYSNVFNNI